MVRHKTGLLLVVLSSTLLEVGTAREWQLKDGVPKEIDQIIRGI
jgi:hypothetical protein